MLNLSSSLVPVYVYICWLYLRVVKENFSMDSFAVRLILLLLPEMTANELLIFITGVVKSNRSIWRLRTITDFFWAIVNFIGVFFVTMFSVNLKFYQLELAKEVIVSHILHVFHAIDGKIRCLQEKLGFWKEMGWWWPGRSWKGSIWWWSAWSTPWIRQCSRDWPQ